MPKRKENIAEKRKDGPKSWVRADRRSEESVIRNVRVCLRRLSTRELLALPQRIENEQRNNNEPQMIGPDNLSETEQSAHSNSDEENQEEIRDEQNAQEHVGEQVVERVVIDEQQQQPQRRKMSEHVRQVSKLVLEGGNIAENWRKFKRNFDIFMHAAELNEKPDIVKVNTFLNAIGESAVEVFDTFNITNEQRLVYNDVIAAFENFCTPKKNEVYERFIFYQRKQKEGEKFDTYLMEIKRLVRTCAFGAKENEMLRDQIVMGIWDRRTQSKLLETTDLTYETAVNKCRASEISREQATTMNKTTKIDEVKKIPHGKSHETKNNNNNNNDMRTAYSKSNDDKKFNSKKKCTYCNRAHKPRECPAYGKECNYCKKIGHFASACRKKEVSMITTKNNYESDSDEYTIGIIENEENGTYRWYEKIELNNKIVKFKIDTGADVNVLPINKLKQITSHSQIKPTTITLNGFGGSKVEALGECTIRCTYGNIKNLKIRFIIVDEKTVPLLGLNTIMHLGMIQHNNNKKNKNIDKQQKF